MGKPSGKGWLYGNNFSAPGRNRLCMVSTPQGKVQRKQSSIASAFLNRAFLFYKNPIG